MALRTAHTMPRGIPATTRRWWHEPDTIIISLTLLMTAAIATTLHTPAKIPPLTIVNEADFSVSLEVRPARLPGWMGLGTFSPGETTVHEVIDQGDAWLIRARAGSHTTAPFAISRAQLKDQHWKMTIPEGVIDALRRDGATPDAWLATPR